MILLTGCTHTSKETIGNDQWKIKTWPDGSWTEEQSIRDCGEEFYKTAKSICDDYKVIVVDNRKYPKIETQGIIECQTEAVKAKAKADAEAEAKRQAEMAAETEKKRAESEARIAKKEAEEKRLQEMEKIKNPKFCESPKNKLSINVKMITIVKNLGEGYYLAEWLTVFAEVCGSWKDNYDKLPRGSILIIKGLPDDVRQNECYAYVTLSYAGTTPIKNYMGFTKEQLTWEYRGHAQDIRFCN